MLVTRDGKAAQLVVRKMAVERWRFQGLLDKGDLMDRRSMIGRMAGGAGAAFAGREGFPLPFQATSSGEGINVRERGARGDGAHDDTDAIQRAINESRAGTPVVIPAGRYRIRKTIVLHDETVVFG